MTATVASSRAGHGTTVIEHRFRFSDTNPVTGDAYSRSRFGDLPLYVTNVIETELGMTPPAWDALVASGEVYAVTGWRRTYSITGWLRRQLEHRRGRRPHFNVCPDCFGSLVDFDADGSVTGRVGTPILCWCAGG
jgi:hypothetical protein